MGRSAIIISADAITPEHFVEFLKKEGAFNPDNKIFPGPLSDGFKHIWIGLDLDTISTTTEGIEDELARSLGRPAQTAIVIEINSEEGSLKLAIDFGIKVLTR